VPLIDKLPVPATVNVVLLIDCNASAILMPPVTDKESELLIVRLTATLSPITNWPIGFMVLLELLMVVLTVPPKDGEITAKSPVPEPG